MMINSLGGGIIHYNSLDFDCFSSFFFIIETLTTSWESSPDVSRHESTSSSSSSSASKDEQRKIIPEHSRSSSEGSLFSDSDNQQDESNISTQLDQERRPTFLMPTV